jgi:crotonobetainyl-CoA:carnitine CoA-transferase CaiB-like acyl-CoA transferase
MDYVGGIHGCFSILQALGQRARDGRGRDIDLAQFECGVGTLGSLLLAGIVDGALPKRMGNRSAGAAPQGCYACAGDDQWCVISVENDRQWEAFVEVLGHPAWAKDARLQSLTGRLRCHDEIDRSIEEWTKTLPPGEVERRLRAAGVPSERMRRMDEILEQGHDSVFHLIPGKTQPTLLTGLPFAFAPRQQQAFGPAPRLGEHTDDALKEWLGLESPAIAKLRDAGALA